MEMTPTGPENRDERKITHALPNERLKSPLRMRYAAETKLFREQHGELEDIRQKLGFSRRKMCELLLVDPSAWTRWTRREARVPPHIYRALEWFLALNQKSLTQPELAAIFHARHRLPEKAAASESTLKSEIARLRADLKRQSLVLSLVISFLVILCFCLVALRV